MTTAFAAALVTTITAIMLTVIMGQQYTSRRRTHTFWWSLSFLLTALASLAQVAALAHGSWSPVWYRVYVLLAASVPAVMGAGSMYLLWRRLAPWYTALVLAGILDVLWGVASSPLRAGALAGVLTASQEVTRVMPSAMVAAGFAVLGGLGGAALVLGALWSYVTTHRRFNLAIAAGGIVFSLGDTLAAYGVPALFYLAEILGVLLLFFAVRSSLGLGTTPTPTSPERAHA